MTTGLFRTTSVPLPNTMRPSAGRSTVETARSVIAWAHRRQVSEWTGLGWPSGQCTAWTSGWLCGLGVSDETRSSGARSSVTSSLSGRAVGALGVTPRAGCRVVESLDGRGGGGRRSAESGRAASDGRGGGGGRESTGAVEALGGPAGGGGRSPMVGGRPGGGGGRPARAAGVGTTSGGLARGSGGAGDCAGTATGATSACGTVDGGGRGAGGGAGGGTAGGGGGVMGATTGVDAASALGAPMPGTAAMSPPDCTGGGGITTGVVLRAGGDPAGSSEGVSSASAKSLVSSEPRAPALFAGATFLPTSAGAGGSAAGSSGARTAASSTARCCVWPSRCAKLRS